MAIRIIRAQDPIKVSRITVCIYGSPGLGKTTLGNTSERALLLDFDGGAHRALHRKDTMPVASWDDAVAITADDLKPYKTVVIDTAGRALEFLAASIMQADVKMRNRHGGLTLQGFGALKSGFQSWLSNIGTMGKDIVLIAHGSESRKGDELIERLDVQGASKDEIYKVSDAMGRIVMENGKRVLKFDPSDASFGKNPGRLPALPIPEDDPEFLGGVIQRIKDALNTESEQQKEARVLMEKAADEFGKLETAEEFTEAAGEHAKSDIRIKQLLAAKAKAKGFVYDKEKSAFVGGK